MIDFMYLLLLFFMLKGGVIQSKNNTFVLIIAYFGHNADSNKEGNQTKDRHRQPDYYIWFLV